MDDYHEFKCAHEIQIEEWQLYWSPNYVSITRGIVAPSGATVTHGINLTNGNGSATCSGTTGNDGTTRGGGATSTWVHCSYLTQLWNFFMNCDEISKRLGLRSYRVYKISNISHESL